MCMLSPASNCMTVRSFIREDCVPLVVCMPRCRIRVFTLGCGLALGTILRCETAACRG